MPSSGEFLNKNFDLPTKPAPNLFLWTGGGEDLGLALVLPDIGSLKANNFFTAWGLAAPEK